MPPRTAYHQEYAEIWRNIKVQWGLTADQSEIITIKSFLGDSVEMPKLQEEFECKE